MRLVLEQIKVNTDSVKELGTNYHRLHSEISKIAGDIQLDFHRQIAQLRLDTSEDLNSKLRKVEYDVEGKIQEVRDEFSKKIDELTREVNAANRAITALQVKAGAFGLLGSLLGFLLVYLAKLIP